MKIHSTEKQPEFKYVVTSDGIEWVYICLDESTVPETEDEPAHYEYDFAEFHAPLGTLDIEDIKHNPAKYRGYEPVPEATQEEKIEAQVMYTALMTDTLLEG